VTSKPEAATEGRPFNVGVSFHHDLYDLAEAVFKTRAIRAFEDVATRYPIHRLVRCAVCRPLEDVFDDLALNVGLAPQRLDRGSLLLDGPGVFVHAEGKRKGDYCSCTFNIWADTKVHADNTRLMIFQAVGSRHLPEQMFVIDWNFCNSRGVLVTCAFEEVAEDGILDEAYPDLGYSVEEFVRRYLCASETVLILLGAPGTGKTRLVRSILSAMSRRKSDSAEVMYTADKRALENDEIFVDFITGSHDAFVIEDADHMLMARTNGNHDLHRFLAIADGVVRAQGRKIIFTTNLPNVRDLDEALLRPGRCFAVMRTRSLVGQEIDRLVARLCEGDPVLREAAHASLTAGGARAASVAQVYRACDLAREQRERATDRPTESASHLGWPDADLLRGPPGRLTAAVQDSSLSPSLCSPDAVPSTPRG
jgi:ATPase family associated with various cellular activities (AAA)